MKVKTEITLDIDVDAWTLNYGVEGARAIRQDVQAYAFSLIREHFRDLGLLNLEDGS